MIGGTINVARAIFSHAAFKREPLTEREAFMWLCMEAAFRPYVRDFNGMRIELDRGQLAASHRFLAKAWTWDRNRVRRFLNRLRDEGMLEIATPSAARDEVSQRRSHVGEPPSAARAGRPADAGCSVIILCNYDKYQPQADGGKNRARRSPEARLSHPPEPPSEPKEDPVSENDRERETRAGAREGSLHGFDDFWNIYPHRGGARINRAAAEAAYARAVEAGIDEATILRGAMRFRQDRRAVEGFAPDPHRWIENRGWEDDLEPPRLKPRVIQGGRANEQDARRRAFDEAVRRLAPRLSDGSLEFDNSDRDPFAPRRGDSD